MRVHYASAKGIPVSLTMICYNKFFFFTLLLLVYRVRNQLQERQKSRRRQKTNRTNKSKEVKMILKTNWCCWRIEKSRWKRQLELKRNQKKNVIKAQKELFDAETNVSCVVELWTVLRLSCQCQQQPRKHHVWCWLIELVEIKQKIKKTDVQI